MIKLFSIFISVLILFHSLNFSKIDLDQMKELLEHIELHKNKYGDGLLVFLSKHYGESEQKHSRDHGEEDKNHEDLPFNHNCCVHSFIVYVLTRSELQIKNPELQIRKKSDFYYQELYSSTERSDIFQPPKLS